MTIDEAIKKYKEKSEFFKKTTNVSYALELEQLAEWLEELKFLRQWKSDVVDEFCKYIDDFAKWLENKKYLIKEIQDHDFCYTHYDELKANCVTTEYFAEQLKAGGTDA